MKDKRIKTPMTKPRINIATVCWQQTLGKVLTTTSLILSSISVLIIVLGPATTGYEISVYDACPWAFWLCLYLAICSGIIALGLQVTHLNVDVSKQLVTVSTVALPHLILILLPALRGYFFFGRGDALTHLGAIKDIVSTQKIGTQNFYPVSHLLVINMAFGTGLDIQKVFVIFPAVLYVIYVLGMFLFARQLGETNAQVLLIAGFGVLPIYTYYFTMLFPSTTSLIFTPLALAVYLRKFSPKPRPFGSRLVLLLLLFLFPYSHVLGALLLIVFLLCFEISRKLQTRFAARRSAALTTASSYADFSLNPSLILLIASLTWFSSFVLFRKTVSKAYRWFWVGVGTPPLERMSSALQKAQLPVAEFLELLIRMNGHHLIYIILSLLAVVLLFRRILSKRSLHWFSAVALAVAFALLSGLYLATLMGDFSFTGSGLRLFTWSLMTSAALNGMVFGEIIGDLANERLGDRTRILCKRAILPVLIIFMCISALIGLFNEYDSPLIQRLNQQVTQQDMAGVTRLLKFTKPDLFVLYLEQLQSPVRSAAALYGLENVQPELVQQYQRSPPHFGYDVEKQLGSFYDSDAYLPITGYSQSMYTQLWPDIGWVTANDLQGLPSDPTVSRVYTNGEFDIWYISTTTR